MNRAFIKFSWITLTLIYLVVIAGSIVRSTGSGMGCPDWPKCFDQVIPPTNIDQLPDNYQEIYLNKRKKKVAKFVNLLSKIGFEEEAKKIQNDPNTYKEETFNWKRTWTEYGNRLTGFIAGNLVLISLIWVLIKYRNIRRLIWLCAINLFLMGFEGWLGSIVVATNLLPWVLTLHMLFALIIIWIQISIINIIENKKFSISFPKYFKSFYYLAIILTLVQILLGVQVRQEVDFLMADQIDRSLIIGHMDFNFYFHRSFSWVILLINFFLFWQNRKAKIGMNILNIILGLILIEFVTGFLFSYANMPAFIQPVHLLIATLILGFQIYGLKNLKYHRESLIR